jgi:hypothetical protein
MEQYAHSHEATWDDLTNFVAMALPGSSDKDRGTILVNPYYAVSEYMFGELLIIGPRYYIGFTNDEDFILFKLKYL